MTHQRISSALVLLTSVFIFAFAAIPAHATTVACTEIYQPVCGYREKFCETARCLTLYHTYSNTCFMNAEQSTLVHSGECTAAELNNETTPDSGGSTSPGTGSGTGGAYVPPKGCMAWYDGCNHCSRTSANGPAMCTLMACMGEPAPGYCTSYGNTTPGTPTPGGSGSSATSTTHINSDGETVTNPTNPPPLGDDAMWGHDGPPPATILGRVWKTITNWFSSLFD